MMLEDMKECAQTETAQTFTGEKASKDGTGCLEDDELDIEGGIIE